MTNDKNPDKDVLFIRDAITQTRSLISEIGNLAASYDVHHYTQSLGYIRASSVMGAVAATAIYNGGEFKTKLGAAAKVLEIYKRELLEIIGNADKKGIGH